MKQRRATPLLRVAAMAATLVSCSRPAQGDDGPPQDPEQQAASRVHLRGQVAVPDGSDQVVYLEIATASGTKRIDLPSSGGGPRPFTLTDADLGGQQVSGDKIHLVVHRVLGGRFFYKQPYSLPLHASGLVLGAYESYLPPIPETAIPTKQAVLAMESAAPTEPGSHLDLEGVIVFDNRQGIPERIGVSVRGEKGIIHKNFVPTASPFRFRLQDSDASEGYPFSGDTVELWVKVRYGFSEDSAIEQTLHLPMKSKGIIAVPAAHEPPKPPPPDLVAVAVDLRGMVKAPKNSGAAKVELSVVHGAGTLVQTLPLGTWPLEFHLNGSQLADIPVVRGAEKLMVTVKMTSEDGAEQYDTQNVAFKSDGLVFEPKPLPGIREMAPSKPVYGNTKGSRYDGR